MGTQSQDRDGQGQNRGGTQSTDQPHDSPPGDMSDRNAQQQQDSGRKPQSGQQPGQTDRKAPQAGSQQGSEQGSQQGQPGQQGKGSSEQR